jgi:hypothetical protein
MPMNRALALCPEAIVLLPHHHLYQEYSRRLQGQVSEEGETAFLSLLPVRVLWGVGPVTAGKLAGMGVTTVGELARLPEEELRAHFGSHGVEMARQAQGIDERPVVTEREVKSVSQEMTFARDVADWGALKQQLWQLSQGVGRRLKRAGLAAGTVAIKLRYADFTTLTRQMALMSPTDEDQVLYRAALVLLKRAWRRGRPVRSLGVAGRHLSPPVGQLPLLWAGAGESHDNRSCVCFRAENRLKSGVRRPVNGSFDPRELAAGVESTNNPAGLPATTGLRASGVAGPKVGDVELNEHAATYPGYSRPDSLTRYSQPGEEGLATAVERLG